MGNIRSAKIQAQPCGLDLLQINPYGLLLSRDARLAQMVFHQVSGPVEGFSGLYQGSGST